MAFAVSKHLALACATELGKDQHVRSLTLCPVLETAATGTLISVALTIISALGVVADGTTMMPRSGTCGPVSWQITAVRFIEEKHYLLSPCFISEHITRISRVGFVFAVWVEMKAGKLVRPSKQV